MDPIPPTSSSSPSDLRRSKRNKFHLDVTTMHLIHPERSRKHASSASPLPRENRDDRGGGPPNLSPQIVVKKRKLSPMEEIDERNEIEDISKDKNYGAIPVAQKPAKKQKSSTGRERNKPHKCKKCPASFDSTISLDLHVSLHASHKKHTCSHCDYSSNSLHAVRTHTLMHTAYISSMTGNGGTSSSSTSPSSSLSSLHPMVQPLSIAISHDDVSSTEGIDEEDEDDEGRSPIPPFLPSTNNGARTQSTYNGKYKCPLCPFTTRDNERLEKHNFGHARTIGFLCPLCTFKSESAGFLKRHVEIHGIKQYRWPPQYVGLSPRMNGIMEEEEKDESPTLIPIGKVLKAAHHASIPRDKIGEAVSAMQFGKGVSSSLLQLRVSSSSSLLVSRIEQREGMERSKRRIKGRGWRKGNVHKCTENGCSHSTRSKARAVLHRLKDHWKKKIVSRRLCGECGLRLKGEAAKRIHWEINHSESKWSRKTLTRYRDERCGVKNEMDEPPVMIREKYGCEECPYSSAVRSKLERHHSKHVLREGFNCKFCSFSCRNDDLLQSHQKWHYYRLMDRSEIEGGMPPTPIPTMEYRVESDSPPALERAESSMGEADEMPVLESVGAPPVLEMQVDMKEEKKGKGGKKKGCGKSMEDTIEKRVVEQLRLIEKAVRIRNMGVIGIKRIGGEMRRRYKCIHCPFTTPFISMLWRHARHHVFTCSPSSSLRHCSDCTFTTSLSSLFSSHHQMHQQARTTFPCEFCLFVGMSARSLDRHIESTGHGTPSIPSRSSPIDDPSNLQMGRSKGDKPISFNLISSQKWMKPSNEEKKLLILINKSKSSRDLQCPECPFSDPNQLIYNLHLRMHKGPKQPFECNVCSYSVPTAEGLHHHISLHIPPDAIPPKRGSIRRRNSNELIPAGVPSFDCSSCTFRTLEEASFHMHKLEHAQLIQQRLVTQIKRAAATDEEMKKKQKLKPNTSKTSKHLPCQKCDFICETGAALVRHQELHSSNGPFECHICDYSSTTKQITDFHILHHHTKMPLANLKKLAILMPDSTKVKVSSTFDEKVALAGQVFVCELCDTQFLEMRQLLHHWEADHSRRGDDTACHLSLGMLPTNRVLTKA